MSYKYPPILVWEVVREESNGSIFRVVTAPDKEVLSGLAQRWEEESGKPHWIRLCEGGHLHKS